VTATLEAYYKVDEGWFAYTRGGCTSTHDDEAGAIARVETYARDRGWTIEPAPVDTRAILIDDADPQLSVRASVCCRNAGWTTLGHLADLTPAEMLRARNLGRKVLNEIRALLAANGLSLRGEA
jgi:DNA-directed RNA polymerase alpha subunit